MSKVMDLREKRAKAWDAAKAFLDTHRTDAGLVSAEDATTYDRMEADVMNLGKEIDRLDRQSALDRELSLPTASPITEKPSSGINLESKSGRASDDYKRAFWDGIRSKITPQVHNALTIGVDADGGYLCPEEYERTLIKELEEENVMRRLCRVFTSASGDRKIPFSAGRGSASWLDEAALIPESDDAFGQITIGAHKVGTIIKCSDELLQDAFFNVEAYVAEEFARRIGEAEESAFLSGNGTAKPTGLLHDTLGAQTGVTSASATAFTADELIDLIYSLRAPYRRKATLLLSDATIKAIRKLKDASGNYLWSPGVKDGDPNTILGVKYTTSSFMPEIGAGAKVILYGDYNYYWISDRLGRTFQRLNELYAANGLVGFRTTQRVDGRLVLPEAVKVLVMKT